MSYRTTAGFAPVIEFVHRLGSPWRPQMARAPWPGRREVGVRGDLAKRSGEQVGAFLRRLRTSLGLRLEDVTERGIAALAPHALLAVCDVLGAGLDEIEDVIRAAQARQQLALESASFDELVARGKKAARRGDIARARALLIAAEDWVSLHPDERPSREAMVDLWIWLGTACVKMYLTRLARRYALQLVNEPAAASDRRLEGKLLLLHVATVERDRYGAGLLARDLSREAGGVGPHLAARIHASVGRVDVLEERFEEAIPRLTAARKLFGEVGETVESLRASVLLGFAIARSQDVSRGRRMIRTCLRFAPRRRNPELYILCHQHLGQIAYELGDPSRGLEHLEQAAMTARAEGPSGLEFLLWWIARRAEQTAGRKEHVRRIERTLHRLLRRVGRKMPEAREFMAEVQRRAWTARSES